MSLNIVRKMISYCTPVSFSSRPVTNVLKALPNDTVELSCAATGKITRTPAVEAYIKESNYLSAYEAESNKTIGFAEPRFPAYVLGDYPEGINLLNGRGLEDVKQIEAVCKQIMERCKALGLEKKAPKAIKCLVDLRHFNPEAYEMTMQSDFLLRRFFLGDKMAYSCVDSLTTSALKAVEDGTITEKLRAYVNDSDVFVEKAANVEELKAFLSTRKIDGPVMAFRAERHTGIFEDIPLNDKILQFRIKLANTLSMDTRKTTFCGFDKKYATYNFETPKTTVYKYICDKKDLTLADAMLMMPYLPKKIQQQILEKIKGVKLVDDRFKSTSLSKKFSASWLYSDASQSATAKILNKIELAEGTQGCYIRPIYPDKTSYIMTNGQCEFLVNAGKKEMVVDAVDYDPKRNLFSITSKMRPIE